MTEALDIFVLRGKDSYDWIAFANTYEEAVSSIRKHGRPGTFFAHCQITGRRTFFQVGSDFKVVQLPGRPPE